MLMLWGLSAVGTLNDPQSCVGCGCKWHIKYIYANTLQNNYFRGAATELGGQARLHQATRSGVGGGERVPFIPFISFIF